MKSRELLGVYLRSLILGVEDSLVSTVGFLSGIAASGLDRSYILLTGGVLLVVEGFSMAAGEFLSERSVEEYTGQGRTPLHYSVVAGVIMFVSYISAGLIPLAPYFLLQGDHTLVSIGLSLLSLFFLGAVTAHKFKIHWFSRGVRMLVIGGLAIGLGIAVGGWVQ